jgi:hypothetical protein
MIGKNHAVETESLPFEWWDSFALDEMRRKYIEDAGKAIAAQIDKDILECLQTTTGTVSSTPQPTALTASTLAEMRRKIESSPSSLLISPPTFERSGSDIRLVYTYGLIAPKFDPASAALLHVTT